MAESCADAEVILVILGSLAGTAREVVRERRAQGVRVGLLKIRCLRPFPADTIAEAIGSAKTLGVVEKAISFGSTGPVFADVSAALINHPQNPQTGSEPPARRSVGQSPTSRDANLAVRPRLRNFIVGLGGREITRDDINGMIDSLLTGEGPVQQFFGLREEPHGSEDGDHQ